MDWIPGRPDRAGRPAARSATRDRAGGRGGDCRAAGVRAGRAGCSKARRPARREPLADVAGSHTDLERRHRHVSPAPDFWHRGE